MNIWWCQRVLINYFYVCSLFIRFNRLYIRNFFPLLQLILLVYIEVRFVIFLFILILFALDVLSLYCWHHLRVTFLDLQGLLGIISVFVLWDSSEAFFAKNIKTDYLFSFCRWHRLPTVRVAAQVYYLLNLILLWL